MLRLLSGSLVAVLALLALNALAYGAFYLADPAGGLREFGLDAAAGMGPGALHLVSMVGIGLLGFAGFAVLAIVRLLRGDRSGVGVALVLGAVYLALGGYFAFSRNAVDALIYGGFGVLVTVLAGVQRRAS